MSFRDCTRLWLSVSICFHFRPFLRTIWCKSRVTALKFRFILWKSSDNFFYSSFTVVKNLNYAGTRPECIFVIHSKCRYQCITLYLEEQTQSFCFELPEMSRKNKNCHDLEQPFITCCIFRLSWASSQVWSQFSVNLLLLSFILKQNAIWNNLQGSKSGAGIRDMSPWIPVIPLNSGLNLASYVSTLVIIWKASPSYFGRKESCSWSFQSGRMGIKSENMNLSEALWPLGFLCVRYMCPFDQCL